MAAEPTDASLPGLASFLDAIDPAVRARILAVGRQRRYAPGESILIEDAPGTEFFVVLTGRVKMFKVSQDGREQVIRHVPAGGSFNEVPVFDGGTNPVSATAAEASELLVILRGDLRRLIAESPDIAEVIIRSLASRLRHMVELVEDLSFRRVTARVARVLLQSVAPHAGVGAGANTEQRLSQRELAEMVGTSREVVARALKALESAGGIEVNRGAIRLVDPAKLAFLS